MPYINLLLISLGLMLIAACDMEGNTPAPDNTQNSSRASSTYTGSIQCLQCHKEQAQLWSGSHHELAMQEATAETVLGDFNDVTYSTEGQNSRFFTDGDRFLVETSDADGTTGIFEIKYTFGVTPLQQYLVDYGDGRLQALGVAWDSRPSDAGGQRWFHLYPNNPPLPGSPLHWTGIDQNWNYQCAECHSTNLKKQYDSKTHSFNTQWSEINVSCEACHGPGSNHVAWANKAEGWEQLAALGLDSALDARHGISWQFAGEADTASRSQPVVHQNEIETCAHCHSRRGIQSEDYIHGKSILDTHRVSRLSDGLYYPDGQIRDEVYVYGSFLQSKMYHEGVTCSDCHEPHSLKLRADGDGVCYQCHKAEHFASEEHHFHQPGSEGSSCVACHMPETYYMVVDPRRDHGIRIPRPDLSVRLGVPNACNRCHGDQDAPWAADKVAKWYGGAPENNQVHAEVFTEARKGNLNVIPDLERLIQDDSIPAIIRATLIDELATLGSPSTTAVIVTALNDKSPMVRQAAVQALAGADDNMRFRYLLPMLDDPVRGVRIEVVRGVLDLPSDLLTSKQRQALATALKDYQVSLQINADRPEAQVEMANLSVAQGHLDEAEAHYREAIMLDPTFAPAYVNWADLQYRQGNEHRGMAILQKGLQATPGNADLSHALGLSLIRQKHYEEALAALRVATVNAPDNARYSYVYAIGLQSTGKLSEAISVLETTRAKHPYNREVLSALVSYYKEAGNPGKAAETYEALQGIPRKN